MCVGLYAVLNDNSQARSYDLAIKCGVIKMHSGLSVLLVINVIFGVRERMHSQPHLVASSGGREKITRGKTNKTVGYDIKCARKYLFLESTCLSIESTYFLFVVRVSQGFALTETLMGKYGTCLISGQ